MGASRLIFLAHGATAAIRAAAFPRPEDDLDARGRTAAEAARGRLPTLAASWSSPALAARRTAEVLAPAALVEPALRDLDAGCWAGVSLAQVAADTPEAFASWIADPAFAGHGGEAVVDLVARVRRWVDDQVDRGGTTLAVTHAAVVRAALLAVLEAPAPSFWRIDAPPLGALVLGSDGRRYTLRGFGPLDPPVTPSGG